MLRTFLRDKRANYLVITAVAMVPIMGALALAVDYAELSRQRQATLNALDAAGIATARQIARGVDDNQAIAYANDFFEANLGPVDPADTTLEVTLPQNSSGGGTLELCAELTYKPYFLPAFHALRGETSSDIAFEACSDVRLKNTLEVALVLDNSGSMSERGAGSSDKRIDILKAAAKQLVDTIAAEGSQLKQISKAVQFGLVPFAAAVNVGPQYANAPWMDTYGLSPVHHENFNWGTMPAGWEIKRDGANVYRKVGERWPKDERNQKVTRFTLYDAVYQVGKKNSLKWAGCVEVRPYPFGLSDTPPSSANPKTLFVPMFAPDEPDKLSNYSSSDNSWWSDGDHWRAGASALERQEYMPKYFPAFTDGPSSDRGADGPNKSCTTEPITPLTDVTTSAGLQKIKDAIDRMQANGNTNVPQGMVWGWHVVSGRAPFTEGRGEQEKGNDKVVIVLTDGANTYSKPRYDPANNKSTYAAYGYAKNGRIFDGTSGTSDFAEAMNQKFDQLCDNAKADDIIVMTVALDLSMKKNDEKKQIEALKRCASDSRFRTDPNDHSKPAKLFWNAQGKDLEDTFKEIADELSNLRIVG